MTRGSRRVICCPCHGAAENGVRPEVRDRLYEVPIYDEPYRGHGLQRQMDVLDATRILIQSGIGETEAVRAISHLNATYPQERWVGAESWRPSLPFRAIFMGAIFPSVRYQYRKDLWIMSQVMQRASSDTYQGHTSDPETRIYENVPDWLQGGRATIIGPQTHTCAWWEATLFLRNSVGPSSEEIAEIGLHLDGNSISDWRTVLDHQRVSELFSGCVSYLEDHGLEQEEAKRRAKEYVVKSISVLDYGGIDWPEGIENPSLTEYTNAERYLSPTEGPIDGDWPTIRHVLSQLAAGK